MSTKKVKILKGNGTVGDRVRQVRVISNKSQAAFGEEIGLGQAQVSYIEIGARMPSQAVLLAILYRFGGNEEWLVG